MNKIFSARFLISVMLSGTTCYGFIVGLLPSEAFLPVALLVIEWYFKREDRQPKQEVEK